MITGIHHISIIVSSEKSLDFYNKLGFVITKKIKREYDNVVLMECKGVSLGIFIDPNHPDRAKAPENLGVRFFSLQVDDVDSFTKDFECTPIYTDWFGKKYCFITDPDGLPIELHE